jgi:YidC/Oxa1 family membrane protein insertase
MNWYYGPTDTFVEKYDRNLEDIVALGWDFGWINRHAFIPMCMVSVCLFNTVGLLYCLLLVKLAMSPITYKSFCHRQKMKVLRPEINELGENSKDPMKSNRKQ